jgi:hypothetical protein
MFVYRQNFSSDVLCTNLNFQVLDDTELSTATAKQHDINYAPAPAPAPTPLYLTNLELIYLRTF